MNNRHAMKVIFDTAPLYWKFPSGISFLVERIFFELVSQNIRGVKYSGINMGARFISKIIYRPFKSFWFPSKVLMPSLKFDYLKFFFKCDVFIATNHFIPETSAIKLYYLYDCIKLKHPNEMNVCYDVEYNRVIKLFNKSDFVLTCSESSKKDIVDYFGDSKKIFVCPPGIDHQFYESENKKSSYLEFSEFDCKRPFIYTCGVIQLRKRFDWSAWLVNELKDIDTLVISGAIDKDGESYLNEIRKKFKATNIVHLGLVSRCYQKILYKECSLFIFPSLYEGFGMPVVEAMAVGGLVLCSDTSSMSEIVESEDQKFIVDSKKDFYNKASYLTGLTDDKIKNLKKTNKLNSQKYTANNVAGIFKKIIEKIEKNNNYNL